MDQKNRLSVLVPCFNEERLIIAMLERVRTASLVYDTEIEVIVVDDASSDRTFDLLTHYQQANDDFPLRLYRQEKNSGKGACIRLAIEKAGGDIMIIQDADLEYDPSDYNRLLK